MNASRGSRSGYGTLRRLAVGRSKVTAARPLLAWPRRRYLDILASVYIYNEHRGYHSLDRVLEAVRVRHPDAIAFVSAVEKHRADERKHYLMFRSYFERAGAMPFAVDRTCGHIDKLIKLTFGCHIDDLDTEAVIADDALFAKLCRIVMITEQRGVRQVDVLLQSFLVRSDRQLMRIFRVVERDEPSHWQPYRDWLELNGGGAPRWSERIADRWVHASLVFVKLPMLYLNPFLRRRRSWLDADEAEGVGARPSSRRIEDDAVAGLETATV